MRSKKIRSSTGGDKKVSLFVLYIPVSSLSFHGIFILFSVFLNIKNKFRLLRFLQQTSKKEKGFGMEELEG